MAEDLSWDAEDIASEPEIDFAVRELRQCRGKGTAGRRFGGRVWGGECVRVYVCVNVCVCECLRVCVCGVFVFAGIHFGVGLKGNYREEITISIHFASSPV